MIDPIAFLQRDVPHRQRQRPATWHRITCIDRDVDERQFKLGDVDLNGPNISWNVMPEFDVSAQRSDKHFVNRFDPLLEINNHGRYRLTARECQELTRQALAATRRSVDGIGGLQQLGLGEPSTQNLSVTARDHQ